jgi:hypothetical protein
MEVATLDFKIRLGASHKQTAALAQPMQLLEVAVPSIHYALRITHYAPELREQQAEHAKIVNC